MSRIIWTRSSVDWQSDKELFANSSTEVVNVPCIATESISFAQTFKNYSFAIVTSRNTIKYADPKLITLLSECPKVYTHGEKTWEDLKKHNINAIRFDVRTAKELCEHIIAQVGCDEEGMGLYPAALDPAFDSAEYLKSKGVKCQHIAVYKTIYEDAVASSALITLKDSDTVCFASPSSVKGFIGNFPTSPEEFPNLKHVALGPTTKTMVAKYFAHVIACPENTMESLAKTALELHSDS